MYNNRYNHNRRNNQNHNHPQKRTHHKDYTPSILSAINRAEHEVFMFDYDEKRRMMDYVISHSFYSNPAQSIHKIVDLKANDWRCDTSEITRDIWVLLRRYAKK